MLLESIFAASGAAIVYHHIAYPLLLRQIAKHAAAPKAVLALSADLLPTLTIIVPACNEEACIEAKLRNCAALDYPAGRLQILVVCDGCTDATVEIARRTIAALGEAGQRLRLVVHAANRGKVAILNETIGGCGSDLVALSDASALLEPNALVQAARHFADESTGFVTGRYEITSGSPSQKMYWCYQTAIKAAEARLGSPIGAHGAFYMFSRPAWEPLAADVINDDVILPMSIVAKGFRGVYDESIVIAEAQADAEPADMHRRRRLAAGALQQAGMLLGLADPRRPGLAFAFLSGKGLRAIMPFLMCAALVSNLAVLNHSALWAWAFVVQIGLYELALLGMKSRTVAKIPGVAALSYLVAGHWNGLIGSVQYLGGRYRQPWSRTPEAVEIDAYLPGSAQAGKRALDIVIASLTLPVFAILFLPIALAIKLESRGPIFYRQLRVGLRTSTRSRLFYLTKFRTMRTDAEARSGAVWASENDPRVTRIGRFLRKSRLDELPQCIDVLRGEMSIVGPRPERPQFFSKLEAEIPFYAERTYGLKPGITGLAQVTLPYDSTIEDVRAKVLHDHAYALQLAKPGRWLITDLAIIIRTFTVMILGKGR